ncbi:hypothetical protein CPLU01_02971 [Colletotrichum plurivorum]|uniref:Uncharacterized protein n=1 Tax=Colletotrichum plurivorum TaxID=2175906 RepID=A0A8H6NLW6_9PEZI|nr:hypothetical protein CPLU01_02971 [Colletotrichum plurivorum]
MHAARRGGFPVVRARSVAIFAYNCQQSDVFFPFSPICADRDLRTPKQRDGKAYDDDKSSPSRCAALDASRCRLPRACRSAGESRPFPRKPAREEANGPVMTCGRSFRYGRVASCLVAGDSDAAAVVTTHTETTGALADPKEQGRTISSTR